MSLFDQLLADPYAQRVEAWELYPYDPDTEQVIPLYYCDGNTRPEGLNTGAADTPANQHFAPRVLSSSSVRRSMFSPERIGGPCLPDFGELVLANDWQVPGIVTVWPPVAEENLDALRTYSFAGRRIVRKLGGILSDGTVLAYGDYGTVWEGTAAGDALVGETTVAIRLQGNEFKFRKPLQSTLYRGFGPCLTFDGVNDDVTKTSFTCPAGSMTIEMWAKFATLSSSQKTQGGWRNGAAAGLRLLVTAGTTDNVLSWTVRNDAATFYAAVDATGPVPVGVWTHIAGVLDTSAGFIYLYRDGVLVATTAIAGAWTTVLNTFTIAKLADAALLYFDGDLDEIRVWSAARTQAQIAANMKRELIGSETGLQLYWKLNDNTGATATDSTANARNGTISGATWAASLEGPADLAGKPKPLLYGEVLELEPVLVDSVRLVYQWHDRTSLKLQAVYDKAVALTPPFGFTATNIAFTGGGANTIHSATMDATALLVGQVVTISGTVSNNGDKTISSISADGQTITTSTALTTEAAGASVTIIHKTGTNGYTVDLTRSTFTLTAPPAGRVTCWARGDAGGSGYVSTTADILRRLSTRHGSLTDPGDLSTASFTALNTATSAVVGYYFDEEIEILEALNLFASGVGAFFGFTLANLFEVGRFDAPSGSPASAYTEAEILVPGMDPVALPPPAWRVIVRYAHNFARQEPENVAAIITSSPARHAFATNEWREARADDSSVLTPYPQARTLTVESTLVTYAAALAEADRLLALYKVRRDMYRTPFKAQPFGDAMNAVVTITRQRFGLDAGRDFRVVGQDGQGVLGQVIEEVWA